MTTQAKHETRNRLSRAPWPGGWGHYAVIDKKRRHWETVCHASASETEFSAALTQAIERLRTRAQGE